MVSMDAISQSASAFGFYITKDIIYIYIYDIHKSPLYYVFTLELLYKLQTPTQM